VAHELRTIGVLVLLQARAVSHSPFGVAILWKAVEVMQIGDLIVEPRILVSIP